MDASALTAKLVLVVHDEVVFDLPEWEVPAVMEIVRAAFMDLLPGMPMTVEARMGETWAGYEAVI